MTSVRAHAPRSLLSSSTSRLSSSAIRDLLDQANQPGMISLAGGLPDAQLFPVEELAAVASAVIANNGAALLQYGPTRGSEMARVGLGSLFGHDVEAGDIVVTTGSQQGLDLLSRVLIDRGDVVVVSDADYLGALQCFRGYGAALHPIAVDGNGMCIDQLEDDLQWGLRPKCLYVVPHFHNPTGASLSAERRQRLAELASRYGFVVIEDDPYRLLAFNGAAPLEQVGDPELTIRLRSTSKVLAPGLRVGAMEAPAWIREAVVTTKQSVDLHTGSLNAAIAAEAIAQPWFEPHVARLQATYGQKCDVLDDALRSTFGDQIDFAKPSGGMFLWLRCDDVLDTEVWLRNCLPAGVCFVPGRPFSVGEGHVSHVRLSFATVTEAELVQAVDRMSDTLPTTEALALT